MHGRNNSPYDQKAFSGSRRTRNEVPRKLQIKMRMDFNHKEHKKRMREFRASVAAMSPRALKELSPKVISSRYRESVNENTAGLMTERGTIQM